MVKDIKSQKIALFEGKEVRKTIYNNEWFFSVVDVVGILSESSDARNYWKVLKSRLINEGFEPVTKCNQLYEKIGQLKLEALKKYI